MTAAVIVLALMLAGGIPIPWYVFVALLIAVMFDIA